jgi:hypothetical protein
MKKSFKISEKNQKLIDVISEKHFGGHYTIFSFTVGYSFSFGTINSREGIYELNSYESIDDAITNSIQELIMKGVIQ